MDPRDRLRGLLAGVACTVCGAAVPESRIDVLAERDDLAFVELRCVGCGSDTLGLVVLAEPGDRPVVVDGDRYGEFGPADEARLVGARPIDADDVLRMHTFLSDYGGDLRTLLDPPTRGADGAEAR